ncbi:anhydro-N-acetylmuramic acid kinase [Fodinicurvata halophila]|uniref:Anhydro-N-acetylmuramic acid kinase n=1 Tax=Fodinicurvata halophila TaxID=1419723 RepID=A0ABV8UJK8_9PROT
MDVMMGLMSGTSLDGVDAALIETDGERFVRSLGFETLPYPDAFRMRLRGVLECPDDTALAKDVERELTLRHADAVQRLLASTGRGREEIRAIGFHGQTIRHDPDRQQTWQMGDAALLSRETGMDVVHDFRTADMRAGGQGAPLAPLYHAVKAVRLPKPLAVLNLGGVGNVTWVGPEDGDILAFDTGPGNALIDDWVYRNSGLVCDLDGKLAAHGHVDTEVLQALLSHPYFRVAPPKSLDRNSFVVVENLQGLSAQDGAATLTAFTVGAVVRAQDFFPSPPVRWLVCGGGRHNPVLMQQLSSELGVSVQAVESEGWNGDALEAECFAYLALRSLDGKALSLPSTTGASRPVSGGRLYRVAAA